MAVAIVTYAGMTAVGRTGNLQNPFDFVLLNGVGLTKDSNLATVQAATELQRISGSFNPAIDSNYAKDTTNRRVDGIYDPIAFNLPAPTDFDQVAIILRSSAPADVELYGFFDYGGTQTLPANTDLTLNPISVIGTLGSVLT